jgi:hypothetical protein
MQHVIYRVRSFEVLPPYGLHVRFDDGAEQTIDLEPVLRGKLYGPLRDSSLFSKVKIDPEVETLVWPNGADFDPETLHDWPQQAPYLVERARHWPE